MREKAAREREAVERREREEIAYNLSKYGTTYSKHPHA